MSVLTHVLDPPIQPLHSLSPAPDVVSSPQLLDPIPEVGPESDLPAGNPARLDKRCKTISFEDDRGEVLRQDL